MKVENIKAGGSGVSVLSLLGVLFIGLKLAGFIDWPWLWVLAPFWIPAAIMVTVGFAALVIWLMFKMASR